ncbi:hypothetical protein [Gracilibacillus saliphilus]|uniref:hypothetical protein n=1 Tax=Gracilibacillus saliphilus TaxID=543890 RepID=UPI0013D5A4C5|nr:hypothetical protein [Gracilibacillus saliphilus]
MANETELKQKFVTGAIPTEQDYHDFIDYAGTNPVPAHTVKANEADLTPGYLDSKVDNVTVEITDNKLVIKNLQGLTIGIVDLNNWLSGTEGNLQDQINNMQVTMQSVAGGMEYRGKFETKADLDAVSIMSNGDLAVVLADESRNGSRSLYVYSENIGAWDFVGNFEFSDEFIALSDTPSSYTGHDGKVAKVDETNGKIVFDNVDYAELQNKPSSSVANIEQAVEQRHTHPNKSDLDRLGVDENNNITIDGVSFTPIKDVLYLGLTTNRTITAGDRLVFDKKYTGNMVYTSTTFTLGANKTYHIVASPLFTNLSGGFGLELYDVTNSKRASEYPDFKYFYSPRGDANAKGNGVFDVIIRPTETKQFSIRVTSISGDTSMTQYNGNSTLSIFEI